MPPADQKPDASYGALISIVLILAIIVVGAFYVWGQRIQERNQAGTPAAAGAAIMVNTASSTGVPQ